MNRVYRTFLLAFLFIGAAASAQAQSADTAAACRTVRVRPGSLTDSRAGLARALSILDRSRGNTSRMFRRGGNAETHCVDHQRWLTNWTDTASSRPWQLLPARAGAHYNSAFPRSVNDDAGWNGVGWNLSASAGIAASWRFLSAAVQPVVFYSQNEHFTFTRSTIPARSEFANPYHANIDYPERFGLDPVETVELGQSYIAAQAKWLDVRASTENLWLGPAEVYPTVLSNTAPGFPHVGIGTSRPFDLRIADVEVQLLIGKLGESDFFDGTSDNDDRVFTIGLIVVQPRFLPGLHLGVARAYHDTLGDKPSIGYLLENLIKSPFTYSAGRAEGNSLGAAYARWVLPESGFEAYFEWSREDAFGDIDDLLREPDWTQGYVLGFQKAYSSANRLTRFYGELIHLGAEAPERGGRGQASYYTHGKLKQGHTNAGQLLGAAIGPGSDAQLLGVDVYQTTNRSSVRIERTRYDDDTYYQRFSRRFGQGRHDIELTLSLAHSRFLGPVEIDAGFEISRRYDRDFISLEGDGKPTAETNVGTIIGLRWQPRW